MTKTILLINSHNPAPYNICENRYLPLGLMYISSVLLKAGYTVKIKDVHNEALGMEEHEIDTYLNNIFMNYVKEINPDFIGIGAIFSLRFKPALKIIQIVKSVFKDVPIAFGGSHATLFPEAILEEYPYINYIVLGEGELSIVRLLDAHFNHKDLLSDIDGIAYRKDNKVIVNPKNAYIENLDNIPFPAYELINIKDYYFNTSDWHNPKNLPINYNFPVITSRGCPRRCTFCGLKHFHGLRYRMRSAKNVVDEVQFLYESYNCRYVSFVDDNMTISKKRTLEIMSEICGRKLDIQFDTSNGLEINTLDEEMLNEMAKAGFIRTALGIESGSEYIRNTIIKKNLKNETIYNFFRIAENYKKIRFTGYFICGFPQETKETLSDTFEMIKSFAFDDVNIQFFIPFYGTEMFNYCCEKGLLNVDIKNLHNIGFTYRETFFIKPFNLALSDLTDFRNKVLLYMERRKRP